jgi:hypothetical protein
MSTGLTTMLRHPRTTRRASPRTYFGINPSDQRLDSFIANVNRRTRSIGSFNRFDLHFSLSAQLRLFSWKIFTPCPRIVPI